MSSIFDKLCKRQLITNYPSFMRDNIHYECMMGSVAYGVSDDTSDIDVYGFCIPPKHILFPYTNTGYIYGFGKKPNTFDQFQKHHIKDTTDKKEYDISIYNIVKFFTLCMENNPNMVDALFVPTRCVLHITQIGNHVRDHRKLFLTKRSYHKFKGYAFSQLHMMKNKKMAEFVKYCKLYDIPLDITKDELEDHLLKKGCPGLDIEYIKSVLSSIDKNGKRSKRIYTIAKYGYDVKFAYHIVRLLNECQQILEECDLDLERSKEHLKAIRNGEWSMDQVIDYFDRKMKIMEELYNKSELRHSPDEESIKNLLLECIEMHYGNIEDARLDKRMLFEHCNSAMGEMQKMLNLIIRL